MAASGQLPAPPATSAASSSLQKQTSMAPRSSKAVMAGWKLHTSHGNDEEALQCGDAVTAAVVAGRWR